LKRAGYDYLIITGKSAKPVYIYLTDEKIEILDAMNLWGKGIFQTNDELVKSSSGEKSKNCSDWTSRRESF